MPERLTTLDQHHLMRALLIGEAAGEAFHGKVACGLVVLNRVQDPRWPDTLHGVILQPWQFSCTMPQYFREDMVRVARHELWWRECDLAAWGLVAGYIRDFTCGANHYYSTIIPAPAWAEGKTPVMVVGKHRFYRL